MAAAVQAARQEGAADHRPVVVHGGVADVDGDRIPPVAGLHVEQPGGDLVQGLLPAHLLPLAAAPAQRPPQAVGVHVDLLEGLGLDAQEAAAERVQGVAADGQHLAVRMLDLDAAHRLAEIAGAMMDRGHAIGYAEMRLRSKTVGDPPRCQARMRSCGR